MGESQTAAAARNVCDDPRLHRLVERFQKLVFRDLSDMGKRFEPELPAEDGSEDENAVALLGQVPEPPGDDVVDALRDRELLFVTVEMSLGREQPHDLADEQRVSFRFLMNRSHELVARPLSG